MKQTTYNKFDRILQENFRALTLPLAGRLLNLKEAEIVYLDRKVHRTLEREMDTLLKYVLASGYQGLLDLEWQAANDLKMAYRMLLYHAMATIVYDLPVIGVVIYIGKEKLNMSSGIDSENLRYNYQIIDFTTLNPSAFLDSDIPEEVIMAILAGRPNFKEKREIVRKILYKLQLLLRHDSNELSRRLSQLEIIGELRDAQKIIIEEENIMALTYNIEKDIRYNQGLEKGIAKGIEKGIAKGIAKGIEKGIEKGRMAVATNLLLNTTHSLEEIAQLADVPLEFVTKVSLSLPKGSRPGDC